MVYKWMKTIDIKGRAEKSSQKNKKSKISNTETRRKSCLIYKPINKSLFEEDQKQQLTTKDTEEKQRSQRKIWGKQVTKIRRKPQRISGIVVTEATKYTAERSHNQKLLPLNTLSTLKNQNLTTDPRPAG